MSSPVLDKKIAVVGLGYVGLPLAVEFGKKFDVVAYDLNKARVAELQSGVDSTQEVSQAELAEASRLTVSADESILTGADVFIITVPTPIDDSKRPDLTPLQSASKLVGKYISKGAVAIYESTVYPGCTEEICVPIIEEVSGLKYNQDFYIGYSPERINPGDKERRFTSILKVTSGSTPETATLVDELYQAVVVAGTHLASSVKVAEACKVIENVQRDTNIALVNELAMIFQRLGINTEDVLKAAGTKWNFLPFRPGLVGGHCIGVDPYYLVHKSESVGYYPEVISAARRLNDSMGEVVADNVMRLMTQNRIHIVDSRILVLGLAFKENCPDLRNTRIVDVIEELRLCNANVDVYDPWVDAAEAKQAYSVDLQDKLEPGSYDAVVVAVAHDQFREMGIDGIRALTRNKGVVYDIKYLFAEDEVDGRL